MEPNNWNRIDSSEKITIAIFGLIVILIILLSLINP